MSLDQVDFVSINVSSLIVDGNAVSLEGHLHSFADVEGLTSTLSGITESGIEKTTG